MAIGDFVAALSVPGKTNVTFYLVSNPGGYFAISGHNLIEAVNTPDGDYSVTVGAIVFAGSSVSLTIMDPIELRFSGAFPPPPPPPPPLTSAVSVFPTSVGPGQTSVVSFTWNDVVIDFTLPAVAVTGGTLSDLTQINGTQYRALFTPTPDVSVTATIQVQQSGTGGAVYFNAAGSTTSASNIATVVVNTAMGQFTVGVNLSGAQNTFPVFASQTVHTYFANRLTGPNNPAIIFRLPFCWSIPNAVAPYNSNGSIVGAQHAAFGPLDTTSTVYGVSGGYMGALAQQIQFAINAGAKLILDCHMFGNGPGGLVGSGAVPTTALADLWGKIAAYLQANPSLLPGVDGLDIMNEWVNGYDSSTVFTANQQSITAIRNAGYTGKIYIEGTNYSSAWNWTSGTGNPFNSSGLYALVDPLNNLVIQPHMYPDPDDSGSHFGYANSLTIPGTAPVGLDVNPTIGVTRMSREYVLWQTTHGLRGLVGEYGSSNDSPWFLGAFDYADWNVITDNLLAYLQVNQIGITLWAGGPGFAVGPTAYCYALDPFNVNLSGLPDYTSTGVQHPAWTVIDKYTGYTGAQPTAYMLFQPGLNSPIFYCTQGVASAPFTLYYGGKITSPVTITPHDFLFDGVTSAGGTFTPSSVTLIAGDNGLATFIYTASQQATLIITTTNDAGWHDPPPISFSSLSDPYSTITAANLTNIYGVFNRFSPNAGSALRLHRSSDGAQMDWSFTVPNASGILGFDRNAIQTWAGARSGISVIRIYGIGPTQQNTITFNVGWALSGTIVGTTLTLSGVDPSNDPVRVGQLIIDDGFIVAPNTLIMSGSGSVWTVNNSQNVSFELMYGIANPPTGYPTFTLQNAAGYPEINVNAAAFGTFTAPINAKIAFSTIYRVNQTSSAQMGPYRMDWFTGPVDTTQTGFALGDSSNYPANNVSVSYNVVNSAYHEYAATWATGVTNGLIAYKDGTSQNTATYTAPTYSPPIIVGGASFGSGLNPANGANVIQFGFFRFFTGTQWRGFLTSLELIPGLTLTSTQIAAMSAYDVTYYSTALGDTLAPIAPFITGTGASSVTVGFTSTPFSGFTLADQNTGTPTDSVVITLTGTAGGTLAGTGLSGSGPYTMSAAIPATIQSQMRALVYTPAGTVTQTETMALAVTSSAGPTANDSNTVVTIQPIANPVVVGTGATICIVGKTNAPFAIPAPGLFPSITAKITDSNPGPPNQTITFTLTGAAGGTLSGAGLSGSGPYTLGPSSLATINTQLGALTYTPAGTAGQTETITLSVVSSYGGSASDANTVVTVTAVAGAETPLAAPGGTFTPINKSGPNIIAASGAYPDSIATQGASLAGFQHIYPQNNEIDYWASKGCGSIRVPLSATRLQPMSYLQLDPPTPRFDGELLKYAGGPYPNGTQVNIAEIKRVLDRCRFNNMYCQLEFHQSVIADRENNLIRVIGNDAESINIAVDIWKRMATVFQHYDNAIFEYFNEPVSSVANNFTCQSSIATAVAAITTLQWNYLPTTSFSGGGGYVSRGEPAVWNPYVAAAPAGLKWALVLHQYLDFDNAGDTQDVVQGKGSTILSAAITSMRAGGIICSLTETGWSPNDAQPNIGQPIPGGGGAIYGTPSIEGNAILNACKTNTDVFIGWNYWLGGDYVFEPAWNTTTGASILSAVASGFHPPGTILDAPQVTVMQANFI